MFSRLVSVRPLTARALVRPFSSSGDGAPLKKTALFDQHVALGGKMVPFAGYQLPVQYDPMGVLPSHLHVRANAGLFDVSHMGQLKITGTKRAQFLEELVVGDIAGLEKNSATLSLMTNWKGGIIDDTIITNKGEHIFMVVNGACKDGDLEHMNLHLKHFNAKHTGGEAVAIQHITSSERSLLALQGPKAAEVLARMVKNVDLRNVDFMTHFETKVAGIDAWVSRCGYTGEDGFEISVLNGQANDLMSSILKHTEVSPTGLAVRDSLRLEAGLCLYGHDLNGDISPVEAGLVWTIGKRRREAGFDTFPGAKIILDQIANKSVTKKRIGLTQQAGPPAREGAHIRNKEGDIVGCVTSGVPSPTLKKSIQMGYVLSAYSKLATGLTVDVRGKPYPAIVSKMPWVPSNYYKKP